MATIRELREAKRLTQAELSSLSTVSIQTISHMEQGRPVSRQSLLRVCNALGVSIGSVQGVAVTFEYGKGRRSRKNLSA